ncbi:hypothetical protein [Loktanella sp. S4079]|nr:hypothetical protein [Loktanella sp. S4079]
MTFQTNNTLISNREMFLELARVAVVATVKSPMTLSKWALRKATHR